MLYLLYDDNIDAPAAIGPYSQAVKAGDLLFVSGCIPLDPETAQVVSGGIEEQTEQALTNLKTVVEAGGSELGKVVKALVRWRFECCACVFLTYLLHRSS